MRSLSHFKTISRILIFAMLHLCWLTSYGWAEMIPTESSIEQPSQDETDRQRILDLLDRQEVIDELENYGISKVEAVARINSMTDAEVTEIAGRLGELPNGGTTVDFRRKTNHDLGAVLLIILGVLVLILGFMWIYNNAADDSPSSNERFDSEPVVEEVCDPGMESCI